LSDMEAQRAELDEAITELQDQLKWGAEKIAAAKAKLSSH
jgi:hypothetical protein